MLIFFPSGQQPSPSSFSRCFDENNIKVVQLVTLKNWKKTEYFQTQVSMLHSEENLLTYVNRIFHRPSLSNRSCSRARRTDMYLHPDLCSNVWGHWKQLAVIVSHRIIGVLSAILWICLHKTDRLARTRSGPMMLLPVLFSWCFRKYMSSTLPREQLQMNQAPSHNQHHYVLNAKQLWTSCPEGSQILLHAP